MTSYNIIIPTYNRPACLRRILAYYDSFGENFEIIVADSSSDKNKKINKKTISSFSGLDIEYPDNYSSKINPYRKVDHALKNVNTKYCVLCADDDFITPNGINQSIEFLEKNPDFTVAHGQDICFFLKNTEKGEQQFCWRMPVSPYKSITSADPKTRLLLHFSDYHPTFYAVHRTDFLKMIFKETLKFTNDVRFGELLPSMLTLIYGKMKRLDVLYGASGITPGSAGQTSDNLKDFIKAGTYDEKYTKFRECLIRHLSKKSHLSREESKRVVDRAMSAYLSGFIKKEPLKNVLINKMKGILDSLGLPDWMDKGIRELSRKLFLPKIRREDFQSSMNLPSKYEDDFNKIRLHVLSFAKQ